ncbi:hypothetical protein HK096_011297, partial [Nowakowskiella sp. JEL0078]
MDEIGNVNQYSYSGLEALLIVLHQLSYVKRLGDMVPIFGHSHTALSMIFNEAVADLHCTLSSLNLWLHRATQVHRSSGCARSVLCANCSVLL